MADRQAQIPGGAYLNDVEEAALYQRQVPGFQYVNETQQTAAGGGVVKPFIMGALSGLGSSGHFNKDRLH